MGEEEEERKDKAARAGKTRGVLLVKAAGKGKLKSGKGEGEKYDEAGRDVQARKNKALTNGM